MLLNFAILFSKKVHGEREKKKKLVKEPSPGSPEVCCRKYLRQVRWGNWAISPVFVSQFFLYLLWNVFWEYWPPPPCSWQHPRLLKLNIDGEGRNCTVPVPAIKTGHWCLLFFSFRNTHCLGKPFLKRALLFQHWLIKPTFTMWTWPAFNI